MTNAFFTTVENDAVEAYDAVKSGISSVVTAVEGAVTTEVPVVVNAFVQQFTTDLGKSALSLANNFLTQAETDFAGAGAALLAAIPAELTADVKDAATVAFNALRVALTAQNTAS